MYGYSNNKYIRKWTSSENNIETTSKITIYDAGAYLCEYIEIEGNESVYFCWEVISREKDSSGNIIETLRFIPGDWIPFDVISSEVYPILLNNKGYEIPGWNIEFDFKQLATQPLAQASQQQAQPLSQAPPQALQAPQQAQKYSAQVKNQRQILHPLQLQQRNKKRGN
jgi:hypothetical protein